MPIQGTTLLNAFPVAYVTSGVIKASSGTLYGLTGYNAKASAQFIQLYNTTAVPADAQLPVVVFAVAASTPFSLDYGEIGRYFSVGICIGNSSTGPSKTIGSADIWYDAQYL